MSLLDYKRIHRVNSGPTRMKWNIDDVIDIGLLRQVLEMLTFIESDRLSHI